MFLREVQVLVLYVLDGKSGADGTKGEKFSIYLHLLLLCLHLSKDPGLQWQFFPHFSYFFSYWSGHWGRSPREKHIYVKYY